MLPKKQRYRPELHYLRGKSSGLVPRRPPRSKF
jgi:hypothetical protein